MGVSNIQSARYITLGQIMGAYTETTRRLLSSTCECGGLSVKSLRLTFYLSKPFLCSIGHAVGDVAKNGETECLEFVIFPHLARPSNAQLVLFGQQFMSFFHSCPVAFRWLTRLTLHNLAFGDSDRSSSSPASSVVSRSSAVHGYVDYVPEIGSSTTTAIPCFAFLLFGRLSSAFDSGCLRPPPGQPSTLPCLW